MKRALVVTGAAGFLGRALRVRLAHEYRLFSVDIRPMTAVSEDDTVLSCDLGEPAALAELWRGVLPHAPVGILHFAAYYDFKNLPDPRYQRLQHGLEFLLARFHEDLPAEAVFVLATSMAAMSPSRPGEKLTELSASLGGWEYPRSKLLAEAALRASGEPGCRHRLVELVLAGVYSRWAELVPLYQAIERVRSASIEKYFLPASPDLGLTYVHLDDAVEAIRLAVLKTPPGKHRFLVGEAAPVTNRHIHREAALALRGRPLPLWRIPSWFAWLGAWLLQGLAALAGKRRFIRPWMIAFAAEHFEFDTTTTTRVLGWHPTHKLSSELPALLKRARDEAPEWHHRNQQRPW